MKKVTAIVRIGLVGEVVRSIEHAGCRCLSAVNVCGLGDLLDPENPHISFEYEGYYSTMSKIEVLCEDEDVDLLIAMIKSIGHTEHPGDGIVYVSAVERAAKIQTGEEAKSAFRIKADVPESQGVTKH